MYVKGVERNKNTCTCCVLTHVEGVEVERIKIHVPVVCLLMSKGSKVPVGNVIVLKQLSLTGSFKQNEPAGMFWKPAPLPKKSGCCWRPGTQALREIRHYQWTTKLCIPKAAFIAYVNY